MRSLDDAIAEYRQQMSKGDLQIAYRGLMDFLMGLRNHFSAGYPDHFVSASIYQGYMDMSYFAVTPKALRDRKLKIALVLLHEDVSFEVWLCGANKQVQKKYWNAIRKTGWNKYRIPASIEGIDSIVEMPLIDRPNFDDPTT